MDAHQIFGYGVTGAGLSYSSSYPPIPSISNSRLFGLNFDKEISRSTIPSPSYSTPVDCDSLTTLSDRQEQSSSTENHSAVSPTESNSYFQQPGPPVDCRIDSLRFLSGGSSLQDVNCRQNIQHTLQQLETALMAPDDEGGVSASGTTSGEGSSSQRSGQRSRAWGQDRQASHVIQTSFLSEHAQLPEGSPVENIRKTTERETSQAVPPGNLKQLLIECAIALSENRISDFDMLIDKARESVFINGDPMQRLGAYLVEGLVARKELSGANIYHGLRCREPESKDLLSYMQILYEICPYLKFGYMAANGAIAETCRNEDRIHIIDFQIAQGTQWVTLLQALAARPGGPPHVRITGIDDPISKYARNSGLEAVGKRLAAMSERFNIPIEFHGVPVYAPDVTRDMLDIRPGEALAVNFPLQLHHTPDESVDVNNPRDELLRLVRSLNPKVTTLVEQESNTNTTPFLNRFVETLDYYLALFESIDVTMPRDQKERIGVEQHCLARDIVNIIACEGRERVERHELFGKWKSRLTMAGFRQYPLSSYVNNVMRGLLKCYSDHYTLVEKDGAMLLGWKKRSLISASAWH